MGWLNDTNTGSYSPFTPGVSVGLRNVGSYQVSGHPYMAHSDIDESLGTDGTLTFAFPYVTKSIRLTNTGSAACMVHFQTAASMGGDSAFQTKKHYLTLHPLSSSANGIQQGAIMNLDVKCKEVLVTAMAVGAGVEVYASLTNIPTQRMYTLTGSGITD
jgi:hypothetical protein